MDIIGLLLPVSLVMGLGGLCAFVWSLRSGQFEDPDGDQHRALFRTSDSMEPHIAGEKSPGGDPLQ